MKIYTYNSKGQVESVEDHRVRVPSHVAKFIEDTIVLGLKEKDIKLLNGENSIEKSLLVNKLRLIIKNDYQNFMEAFMKGNYSFFLTENVKEVLVFNQMQERQFAMLKSELIQLKELRVELDELIIHSLSQANKRINVLSEKLSVLSESINNKRLSLHESTYALADKLNRKLHCDTNYINESNCTLSDDSLITKLVQSLIQIEARDRIIVYLILHNFQMLAKAELLFKSYNNSNSTELPKTYMASFVVGQQNWNDSITWKIEIDDKEIISILISDCNSQDIHEIKEKLESGYRNYQMSNAENRERVLKSRVAEYAKTTNPSYEHWEQLYFKRRESLIRVEDLNNETIHSIPICHYIVLIKNDDVNKLYTFNDVIVRDLLSICTHEFSDNKFLAFYEKMYEFNFIKKQLGVSIYNEPIPTTSSLDPHKKSTNRYSAVQKIMYCLKPILNENYLVNPKQKDKVEVFFRDLFLSDIIPESLYIGVKNPHFSCFNLKIFCSVIGFFTKTSKEEKKKQQKEKPNATPQEDKFLFKGPANSMVKAMFNNYFDKNYDFSNFSKAMRTYKISVYGSLTDEMIVKIEKMYKNDFK